MDTKLLCLFSLLSLVFSFCYMMLILPARMLTPLASSRRPSSLKRLHLLTSSVWFRYKSLQGARMSSFSSCVCVCSLSFLFFKACPFELMGFFLFRLCSLLLFVLLCLFVGSPSAVLALPTRMLNSRHPCSILAHWAACSNCPLSLGPTFVRCKSLHGASIVSVFLRAPDYCSSFWRSSLLLLCFCCPLFLYLLRFQ